MLSYRIWVACDPHTCLPSFWVIVTEVSNFIVPTRLPNFVLGLSYTLPRWNTRKPNHSSALHRGLERDVFQVLLRFSRFWIGGNACYSKDQILWDTRPIRGAHFKSSITMTNPVTIQPTGGVHFAFRVLTWKHVSFMGITGTVPLSNSTLVFHSKNSLSSQVLTWKHVSFMGIKEPVRGKKP